VNCVAATAGDATRMKMEKSATLMAAMQTVSAAP
jgi:hypothetical protein